eukprot:2996043-Pyramimonas_sp.AAC.1
MGLSQPILGRECKRASARLARGRRQGHPEEGRGGLESRLALARAERRVRPRGSGRTIAPK